MQLGIGFLDALGAALLGAADSVVDRPGYLAISQPLPMPRPWPTKVGSSQPPAQDLAYAAYVGV